MSENQLDQLVTYMKSCVNGNSLVRYGYADKDYKILDKINDICFYAVKSHRVSSEEKYLFSAYNGGYQANTGLIPSEKVFELPKQRQSAYTYIKNEYSLDWVNFLLAEDSPWQDLFQFLINKDVDFCNEVGFIFSTEVFKNHHNLFFNFLIATRNCQEFPGCYWSYYHLVREFGISPKLAAIIAVGFAPTTSDFKGGKWARIYGDCHLFGLSAPSMAFRFTESNPHPSLGMSKGSADGVFYTQDAHTKTIKNEYPNAEDMIGDFLEMIRLQKEDLVKVKVEAKKEGQLANA